jgi:hypothetical protein
MNTTEAAQSAPPDGLVGGRGKDTVSVGLEFALKRWHPKTYEKADGATP